MTGGEQAQDYLRIYRWSCIPLIPGTKRPLVEIRKFQSQRAGSRQLEAWQRRWPRMNLGVMTGGLSGFVALDVDIKPWADPPKRGDLTLQRLVKEHGKLPATVAQTTWSGGHQVLFRYVPGIRNSASKLGRDLDVRGEGGYIAVPPSVVTEDGRTGTYTWLPGRAPSEMAIAEMPAWLIRLVLERQEETESESNPPAGTGIQAAAGPAAEAPLPLTSSLLVFQPAAEAVRVLRELLDTGKPGDKKMVRCPAHADTKASLRVFILPDGRPWLKCFGQDCPRWAILKTLGFEYELL